MAPDYVTMEDGICKILIQERHLNQQDDLFSAIETIIDSKKPNAIEVDLADINRLNSNGIGRLVYLKRYIADELNLPFTLKNINASTLKILKSVKVDIVLGIQS